jgi:hypothetical protein
MPVLVGSTSTALEEFDLDLPTRIYLGDSGIVLAQGDVADAFGCVWKATGKNVWGSKPAPREQVGDRTYDHGQWDATRYYGPRLIPINGVVKAPDHAALHAAEQRLRNAIGVLSFTMRATEPGFDSYAVVRQQGEIDWFEDGWQPPHATFSALLYAPDPRIWSMLERNFNLDFPSVTGGLEWPATWPATWDADVVSGSAELLNPGNEPIGLSLRVDGPVDELSIRFPDTGETLHLDNPDGNLLTVGQYLLVDTATRQVLLNGDAGRRSWAYGDWLLLPAVSLTTLEISGTGTTADSHVSGSYRAARI